MLGRRSHARVSIESSAEGVLSFARDVSVRVNGDGQLVAISRDAGALGERVRVVLADERIHVLAEIVESKLIVREGAVRHRLLMRPLGGDGDAQDADDNERAR